MFYAVRCLAWDKDDLKMFTLVECNGRVQGNVARSAGK